MAYLLIIILYDALWRDLRVVSESAMMLSVEIGVRRSGRQ
jgi:hypothetical protein